MYHLIPLTPEEIALVRSVMDAENADIAAFAACTPIGRNGLAVLCLDEEQRKRARVCIHRAMAARQAVWIAGSDSADKVLAEVGERVERGALQTNRKVVAAGGTTPDVGIWTPLFRLEQYFRPHIVDSERVEHRLRGLGVELYCQNRPTDAFAQLLAGERGCFSSRNLVGKGKRLAREYVERRIALAKFAEQYGLGKLIARPRRRTKWQWDVSWLRPPTERRKMPFSYLTAEDEEAIAQLANWPPAPPTRRPEAYLR